MSFISPTPTLQANLNPHFCFCLSLFCDKAATIYSNTLSSKSHSSGTSEAQQTSGKMLLRAAHCFAPHFVGNMEVAYFGNFDSIKLTSANVFCKGSARKYLGLPSPYCLFGNDPSLLLQSVSDKITCQRQESLSPLNTLLFTNTGCRSDSALGLCDLPDTGADHRPTPLCFCPLFILRDQFHFCNELHTMEGKQG